MAFDEPDTQLVRVLNLVAIETDIHRARIGIAAHQERTSQIGSGIERVVRRDRQDVERGVRAGENDVLDVHWAILLDAVVGWALVRATFGRALRRLQLNGG